MTQMSSVPEYAGPDGARLTEEMRASFEDAGVLILRGFASREACEGLRARTMELVDAFDQDSVRSVFSTLTNVQQNDDYFLRSGSEIAFFFEDGAFDARGGLRRAKIDSLNKMGHAMHDLDPVFDRFSRTPALAAVAEGLGFGDPLLVQSMYIFKPPDVGGEVRCHQDSTYLYTEPESCVGFWFAIDGADAENGCMHFLPGAHKGPLRERNRRGADGRFITEAADDAPFPDVAPAPAEAAPGDLVIFHGRAPHMSAPNRSARARHAYTVHMIDGRSRWPEDNWLKRPAHLPFRGFA